MNKAKTSANIVDHVGIACTSISETAKLYQQAFALKASEVEELTWLAVRVQFLSAANTRIELLEPIGADGPLAKFIAKRGAGLHHICFAVPDISQALNDYQLQGYQLIDHVPRKGAEGSQVAFIQPKSFNGVLIELVQKIT